MINLVRPIMKLITMNWKGTIPMVGILSMRIKS